MIKKYDEFVKESTNPCGLTENELKMVEEYLFSNKSREYIKDVNKLKILLSAFNKIPKYVGTVYRGAGFYDDNILKNKKIGDKYNPFYASASKNEEKAKSFDKGILMEFHTKSAIDISSLEIPLFGHTKTSFHLWQEVILGDAYYIITDVINKTDNQGTTHILYIFEEIKS